MPMEMEWLMCSLEYGQDGRILLKTLSVVA
jgi:hypothetical protein